MLDLNPQTVRTHKIFTAYHSLLNANIVTTCNALCIHTHRLSVCTSFYLRLLSWMHKWSFSPLYSIIDIENLACEMCIPTICVEHIPWADTLLSVCIGINLFECNCNCTSADSLKCPFIIVTCSVTFDKMEVDSSNRSVSFRIQWFQSLNPSCICTLSIE